MPKLGRSCMRRLPRRWRNDRNILGGWLGQMKGYAGAALVGVVVRDAARLDLNYWGMCRKLWTTG